MLRGLVALVLLATFASGNEWTVSTTSAAYTQGIRGVSMVNSTAGWAVGKAGTVLKYDGTSWAVDTGNSTANLYAVSMVSATAGWAVGEATILKYDGSAWAADTIPGTLTEALRGVSMVSTASGWAVGDAATVLKYDGASWTADTVTVSSGSNPTFRAVSMVSSTAGWAVGNSGTVFKYDGTSWAADAITGTVSARLDGVSMVSTTAGWAVGNEGTVLKYDVITVYGNFNTAAEGSGSPHICSWSDADPAGTWTASVTPTSVTATAITCALPEGPPITVKPAISTTLASCSFGC